MSSADVLAYLVEQQCAEGIPGFVMAARLGMGETTWSHVRRGKRRLTVAQIERAIQHYPELAVRFAAADAEPAEAAS
jgi:hypothetical protein